MCDNKWIKFAWDINCQKLEIQVRLDKEVEEPGWETICSSFRWGVGSFVAILPSTDRYEQPHQSEIYTQKHLRIANGEILFSLALRPNLMDTNDESIHEEAEDKYVKSFFFFFFLVHRFSFVSFVKRLLTVLQHSSSVTASTPPAPSTPEASKEQGGAPRSAAALGKR